MASIYVPNQLDRGETLHHIRLLTLVVLHFVATVELAKISLEPQKNRLFFDRPPPAKRCLLPPPLRLHLLSDGHAISNISDDNYHRRRFVPGGGMAAMVQAKIIVPKLSVKFYHRLTTISCSINQIVNVVVDMCTARLADALNTYRTAISPLAVAVVHSTFNRRHVLVDIR